MKRDFREPDNTASTTWAFRVIAGDFRNKGGRDVIIYRSVVVGFQRGDYASTPELERAPTDCVSTKKHRHRNFAFPI